MLDYTPTDGFDATQAHQEGWGLYTAFGEVGVITDITRAEGSTVFPDDIAARDFIAEKIRAGSDYHADALRFLRRTDMDGYRVFREEHPDCTAITDTDPLF